MGGSVGAICQLNLQIVLAIAPAGLMLTIFLVIISVFSILFHFELEFYL